MSTRHDTLPSASQEELERRRARASRFGVEDPEAPTDHLAASLEEERKRRARADKFQTDYVPPTDQVLMDVGTSWMWHINHRIPVSLRCAGRAA